MRFASPQWLWVLLVVPLLYGFLLWDQSRKRKRFEVFAHPSVWSRIAPELDWNAPLRKGFFWMVAAAFAILAMAQPQWGRREETLNVSGLDVVVALDVSNSMEVEDVVPNRLKKAKHVIRSIFDRLDGDRVGIVAFAASTYVACPLTTDIDYAFETVEILGPKMVVNQGTDIGLALETAANALNRGAEEAADKNAQKNASRVIILISDGEDQEDKAIEGAKKVKEAGARLYVFGIGTQKGGPVPMRDEAGQLQGYKKERAGTPVVSAFKPDVLTKAAEEAGGRYWNITPNEAEVEEMLADLGGLQRGDYAERKVVTYQERYQIPLALAVVCLLFEFSLAASHRRKNGLLGVLLAAVLLSGGTAHAGLFKKQAPLDVYRHNQKGLKAYSEGKLDEAKKSFGEAQAIDPSIPELRYNEGVIAMKEGNADRALQGFAESAKGALEQNDPKLAGKSFFNLGSVLSQKGDLGNAVRSYLSAIDSAVASKDKELENDARKNLQLLLNQQKKQQQQKQDQQKQQEQQKQQQKQDQQKQEQQKEDEQKQDQQKQDQKKQEQQDKGQQNQQQQQNQENQAGNEKANRRREFKSQKLSKEDADRVMAELSNRERELQAKLRKQRGKSQGTQKDW